MQLPPGGPELATGDAVHVALVPPATGLVDAGELKPARVVRVIDSIRGTSCVALTWDLQAAPGLAEQTLDQNLEPAQNIEAA